MWWLFSLCRDAKRHVEVDDYEIIRDGALRRMNPQPIRKQRSPGPKCVVLPRDEWTASNSTRGFNNKVFITPRYNLVRRSTSLSSNQLRSKPITPLSSEPITRCAAREATPALGSPTIPTKAKSYSHNVVLSPPASCRSHQSSSPALSSPRAARPALLSSTPRSTFSPSLTRQSSPAAQSDLSASSNQVVTSTSGSSFPTPMVKTVSPPSTVVDISPPSTNLTSPPAVASPSSSGSPPTEMPSPSVRVSAHNLPRTPRAMESSPDRLVKQQSSTEKKLVMRRDSEKLKRVESTKTPELKATESIIFKKGMPPAIPATQFAEEPTPSNIGQPSSGALEKALEKYFSVEEPGPQLTSRSSISDMYKMPQSMASLSLQGESFFDASESVSMATPRSGKAFNSFDSGSNLFPRAMRFPGTKPAFSQQSFTARSPSRSMSKDENLELLFGPFKDVDPRLRERYVALVQTLRTRKKLRRPADVEFVNYQTKEPVASGYLTGDRRYHTRVPDPKIAIQSGTYGVVYQGILRGGSGDLTVAIKVPNRTNSRLEDSLASLLHEVEVMLEVPDHPNIVNLVAVCVPEFWVVMTLADGADMAVALPMCTSRKIFDVIVSMVNALTFLHSHGPLGGQSEESRSFFSWRHKVERKQICVHRDVKLENILLNSSGTQHLGSGNALLCDFGNAAVTEVPGRYPGIKAITWFYAPPELLTITNQKTIYDIAGPEWDAWSFGCVLVELLGFRHPFQYLTPDPADQEKVKEDFLRAYLANKFVPQLSSRLPQPLFNAILGLLHPDPAQRLTFKTLQDDLRRDRKAYADAVDCAVHQH